MKLSPGARAELLAALSDDPDDDGLADALADESGQPEAPPVVVIEQPTPEAIRAEGQADAERIEAQADAQVAVIEAQADADVKVAEAVGQTDHDETVVSGQDSPSPSGEDLAPANDHWLTRRWGKR